MFLQRLPLLFSGKLTLNSCHEFEPSFTSTLFSCLLVHLQRLLLRGICFSHICNIQIALGCVAVCRPSWISCYERAIARTRASSFRWLKSTLTWILCLGLRELDLSEGEQLPGYVIVEAVKRLPELKHLHAVKCRGLEPSHLKQICSLVADGAYCFQNRGTLANPETCLHCVECIIVTGSAPASAASL